MRSPDPVVWTARFFLNFMPRISKREVLADRQTAAQPALFDDAQFPVEAAALESIRARRYEHQGVRLTEDDAKALRLVELITLKWGVKKISRDMMVSPHTVRAARRLLVTQGKLAPYKQRVLEAMEDVIESGIVSYRDAIEEGRVSGAQIPVGLGIIFDKRQLILGEPTSIRADGVVQDDGLKVEDLNRYLEALPSCKSAETGLAIDSESIVNVAKSKQTAAEENLDATLDVSSGQPGADLATDGHASVQSDGRGRTDAGSPRTAAVASEGGGGGPDRPEADLPDQLGSTERNNKRTL